MPRRSESPPERTAARAALTRTFEAILHDQNRFSYFLDFLSHHAQAHKLLFWFEIEQFKLLAGDDREMASHQGTIFGKYFAEGSRGGGGALALPFYAVEHTEILYARARGRPLGYMFDIAQAFVYQELRDRWLPRFQTSSSHSAMLDALRMAYPVSLTQLLTAGPFNDCLNTFIYDSGECPSDLRANFQVWFVIYSTLRPLCTSLLRTLEQRGVPAAKKDLGNFEEEILRFREAYLEGPTVIDSPLDENVRALIAKRISAVTGCKPSARTSLGIHVGGGVGAGGVGGKGNSYADSLRAAVTALSEALALGQEQVYRPLEEEVIPALKKSTAFGNFVDDLSSLECAPLQARLRLLNDWADVQRKLPDKAMESSAGGRTSHLLRPCPTPSAPDVWPVPSSNAGGMPTFDWGGGRRRSSVNRGVRAGAGADVTCPSLLFVFQVETEETTELLDSEENASLGDGGGGLFGHAPRGLHGCAAQVSPSRSRLPRGMRDSRRKGGNNSGLQKRKSDKESFEGGVPESSPVSSSTSSVGDSSMRTPTRSPSPVGARGSGSPGRRRRSSTPGTGSAKMLRRFRTRVKQMRHVFTARVLQESRTPPQSTGGGRPSVPGEYLSSATGEDDVGDGLDLLAGMPSDDTNYRKVRARLNGQILELMEADVPECLPRYCLPTAIARIEGTRKKSLEETPNNATDPPGEASVPVPDPANEERQLPPQQQQQQQQQQEHAREEILSEPTVHHFVLTVPRKRSPPGSPSGSPSRGRVGGAGVGVPGGGSSSSRATSKKIIGGRRGPPAGANWRNREEQTFPVAVDRRSNLVLHAACATVWKKVETPARRKRESGNPGGVASAGSGGEGEKGSPATGDDEPGTVVYLPRCVCALSFDPLFDTLRAVALARGGFPEEGRALMLGGASGAGDCAGGYGGIRPERNSGVLTNGSRNSASSGAAAEGSRADRGKSQMGRGDADPRGAGGDSSSVDAAAEADPEAEAQWGLGEAATLQTAPPPLPSFLKPGLQGNPIPSLSLLPLPPPLQTPPVSSRAFEPVTPSSVGSPQNPVPTPTLLQSTSNALSFGWGEMGGSSMSVGLSRGQSNNWGGAEAPTASAQNVAGWSSFRLPPLVPLDHPVEPLFEALSADNVLLALSALLCERPVVVTCSVRSLLSLGVSSLKALLHPLGWHHAYAPLLPAAEVVRFWNAKLSLDRRNELFQGRTGSPPRISLKQWGARGHGRGSSSLSPVESTSGPPPPPPAPTPFLVGLDADLVGMATRGHEGRMGPTPAADGGWIWGVKSSESCMVPSSAEADSAGIATTQPSSSLLDVVRCMLKESVHIDLDNDEVSWPGSRGSSSRSSPDEEELNSGGGGKSDRMSRGGDALFELGSPSARGQSGGGGDGGGGSGSRERAAFGGAPPAWPEEAAWRARRVMQATLFPEFETFDAVSSSPPEPDLPSLAATPEAASAGASSDADGPSRHTGPSLAEVDEDDSASFACNAGGIGGNGGGVGGGGRNSSSGGEVALRDKIRAVRSSSSSGGGAPGSSFRPGVSGAPSRGNWRGGRAAAGHVTVNPYSLSESVVGMYQPTAGDLALRAAAANLVASVLGRVKEFTTLSAQSGLLRFDTEGFVSAVARSAGAASKVAGNAAKNYESNASSSLSVDAAVGSTPPTVVSGGGGDDDASVDAPGRPSSRADVGTEAAGGEGGRDGGMGGDAGWDHGGGSAERKRQPPMAGVEMCRELVRTRGFAALLSDEVFADVDLETLQAELRAHSAMIRRSMT